MRSILLIFIITTFPSLYASDLSAPLIRALRFGEWDAIEANLDKTMINAQDACGNTPLHLIAMRGRGDLIAKLLALHADPNICDRLNTTPLGITLADASDTATWALLQSPKLNLAKKVNSRQNLLECALSTDEITLHFISLLLARVNKFALPLLINSYTADNQTPLIKLILRSDVSDQDKTALAKELITHGANVNLCPPGSCTPLWHVVTNPAKPINCGLLSLLLAHGATTGSGSGLAHIIAYVRQRIALHQQAACSCITAANPQACNHLYLTNNAQQALDILERHRYLPTLPIKKRRHKQPPVFSI